MTRALIMAGGADEKWTNLGGEGRRHFQVICGERVIDRLVRQLRERGIEDIGIICPPKTPPETTPKTPPETDGYDIEGTYRIAPTYDAWGHEGLNGRAHWSKDDRTLMVYGDVVFTDTAMDRIAGFTDRRFMMFGRFGNSPTRKGGGELFAFSFWPDQADEWEAAVLESFRLRDLGVIKRGGSWEGYRYLAGARGRDVQAHRFYPRFFMQLHDRNDRISDDFDKPPQFAILRAQFEAIA